MLGRDTAYRRHAQASFERLPAHALGNMAFVEGTAYHLWHGKPEHRAYKARHEGLDGFDYNPASDIPSRAQAVVGNGRQRSPTCIAGSSNTSGVAGKTAPAAAAPSPRLDATAAAFVRAS